MKTYETKYGLIEYFNTEKYIKISWKVAEMDSADFRKIIDKAMDVTMSNDISGWVLNMSEEIIVPIEDRNWLFIEVVPKVVMKGIKKVAFIVSEDYYNKKKKYGEQEQTARPLNVLIHFFTDEDKALEWVCLEK